MLVSVKDDIRSNMPSGKPDSHHSFVEIRPRCRYDASPSRSCTIIGFISSQHRNHQPTTPRRKQSSQATQPRHTASDTIENAFTSWANQDGHSANLLMFMLVLTTSDFIFEFLHRPITSKLMELLLIPAMCYLRRIRRHSLPSNIWTVRLPTNLLFGGDTKAADTIRGASSGNKILGFRHTRQTLSQTRV